MYTTSARNLAGGTDALVARVQTYVEYACQAYTNSLINLRMRTVWVGETSYNEDVTGLDPNVNPFYHHLDRVTGTSDGYMDNIHSIRSAYQADACSLLVADNSMGGLAWCCAGKSYGFAVVYVLAGADTFTHEFGHNQGCAHNYEDVDCGGCDTYCRAHHFDGNDLVHYGTVMSYRGTDIPYFSNPYVYYAGQPTGIEVGETGEAYNAKVVHDRRDTMANWNLTRADIWVDFSWGGFEFGLYDYPYNTLSEGVGVILDAVNPSELPSLWIEAGLTSTTMTISKPMQIHACGGTVTIGVAP